MLNKNIFALEFQGLGEIRDLFKISKRFFKFLTAKSAKVADHTPKNNTRRKFSLVEW